MIRAKILVTLQRFHGQVKTKVTMSKLNVLVELVKNNMNPNDIKITGHWGHEPIWRYKTPEEKLQDTKIKPEEAMTYLALLADKDNNHI